MARLPAGPTRDRRRRPSPPLPASSPAPLGRPPPLTPSAGSFGRPTGAPPSRLPPRWTADVSKLDPSTVLDFSTTNDITGGASGSPVVNPKGQTGSPPFAAE